MKKYFLRFSVVLILFIGAQCRNPSVKLNVASVIFEDNNLRSQFKIWGDTIHKLSQDKMIGNWTDSKLSVDVSVFQNCFIMKNSQERHSNGVFAKRNDFQFTVGNITYNGLSITLPPDIEERLGKINEYINIDIDVFESKNGEDIIISVKFNRSLLVFLNNSPRDELPWLANPLKSDGKLHLFSL